METTEGKIKKQPKYWAISLAAIMATAFVLVQPAMQAAFAELTVNGLPVGGYDNCAIRIAGSIPSGVTFSTQYIKANEAPDDPISQNTVKNRDIVKTIHAEKEVFDCFLVQGDIPVIVDVTTYLEVYENITAQEVIATNVFATTCLKEEATASVIDCESYTPTAGLVPVGSDCFELEISHPQEMNTVNKGKIAKTVETQKEQFLCDFGGSNTLKKVDIVIFQETYEDLNTQTTDKTQFLAARCIVLVNDDPNNNEDNDAPDAVVEGCTFNEIPN